PQHTFQRCPKGRGVRASGYRPGGVFNTAGISASGGKKAGSGGRSSGPHPYRGAKAVFDASKGKYVFVPAGSPSPTDKPAASAASIAARGLKNIAVAPWTDLFK